MNAVEAKHLTIDSRKRLDIQNEKVWLDTTKLIFEQVGKAATEGHSETTFDLKTSPVSQFVNKNLDKVQKELQMQGYKIEFLLTRTPNGERSMTVSW